MELKYFKLIKTIAEEGSIANSSEKLFLTQSALSHQLRELEARLSFKVFYRSRNKWELTEEGKELYQLGSSILNQLEKGFQNIEQLRKGTTGTIKISTECYSFYQGLGTFIQKMGMLYPAIKVDLVLEATHHPIPKLLSQEIDMAIVTEKPNNPLLSGVAIYEDEIFVLMHKEHPLNEHGFVSAEDFEKEHLLIHSYPLETVSIHQQFLKPNACVPQKISAIPLTEVALELVSANMGIMCMPKWALKSFKIPDTICYKQIGKNGFKRTHYLVTRKSDMDKKYINDFITNFIEEFN